MKMEVGGINKFPMKNKGIKQKLIRGWGIEVNKTSN